MLIVSTSRQLAVKAPGEILQQNQSASQSTVLQSHIHQQLNVEEPTKGIPKVNVFLP